jgi:hypothetical protein
MEKLPLSEVIEKLVRGINAAANLMDNSTGVDGLHLNGDVAPWGELRTGGQFEELLVDFDEALEWARVLSRHDNK